jgi:uncharacterized protein YbjT (DUF2867 family)
MKLLLLGSTGHTGREILRLATERGHTVTALARSPQKLTPAASLRVVRGDARSADDIFAALGEVDAVLSAIGPRPREAFRPSTLLTDCARATVKAMLRAEVSRLAIVSAAVLFPEKGIYFAFFRWLLRHHARDLLSMEQVVQNSPLAWTIARPPRLTHSTDDRFKAAAGALPPGSRSLSYRAAAAFLLGAVESRSHIAEIVGLGSVA